MEKGKRFYVYYRVRFKGEHRKREEDIPSWTFKAIPTVQGEHKRREEGIG